MLDNPHRCVIDQDGYYITLVLLIEQPDGSTAPYAYMLCPGDTLIETPPPANMLKPRWVDAAWEETASPKEIEDWKASKPVPLPAMPTKTEQDITALQLALAELAEVIMVG